jgi:hypothetical protein
MTGSGRFQEDKHAKFCIKQSSVLMELTAEHAKLDASNGIPVLRQATGIMSVLSFKPEWMRVHFYDAVGVLERELITERIRALIPLVDGKDDFRAKAVLAMSTRPPAPPTTAPGPAPVPSPPPAPREVLPARPLNDANDSISLNDYIQSWKLHPILASSVNHLSG